MERIDFIPNHPELKVIQDDSMFLINSDTQVLGEFIEVYKKDRVLDVGTNTGGLLLYASLFNPYEMVGIDINEKALAIARRNMELNNINNVTLIHKDIREYSDTFDVVICNPPYFKTKENNLANNEYKNLAKHEMGLHLDVLIKSLARNLRDSGTLYFLNLSSRLDEVIIELNKNNLKIKKLKFVYDINKEVSNVCLIKAVKNAKQGMNVYKPIIIERNK